jgi:hypothetical protein
VVDLDTAFDQQLFHVAVGQAVASRYHRTATTITSAGNRNPTKAELGGSDGPGPNGTFTPQAA